MNIASVLTTVQYIKLSGPERDLNLPEAMSWSRHYHGSCSFKIGKMATECFLLNDLHSVWRDVGW